MTKSKLLINVPQSNLTASDIQTAIETSLKENKSGAYLSSIDRVNMTFTYGQTINGVASLFVAEWKIESDDLLVRYPTSPGVLESEEHLFPTAPEKSSDEQLLKREEFVENPMFAPPGETGASGIQITKPEPGNVEEPLIPPDTIVPSEDTTPAKVIKPDYETEEPLPVPVEKLPDYKPNKKGNE